MAFQPFEDCGELFDSEIARQLVQFLLCGARFGAPRPQVLQLIPARGYLSLDEFLSKVRTGPACEIEPQKEIHSELAQAVCGLVDPFLECHSSRWGQLQDFLRRTRALRQRLISSKSRAAGLMDLICASVRASRRRMMVRWRWGIWV